jgi:hypothetical protein
VFVLLSVASCTTHNWVSVSSLENNKASQNTSSKEENTDTTPATNIAAGNFATIPETNHVATSLRTWTTRTGNHFVASYVKVEEDRFYFMMRNGKHYSIPLNNLNDEVYLPAVELRTWKTIAGDQFIANYVGTKADQVVVKKENGKHYSIPRRNLSEDDQTYCKTKTQEEEEVSEAIATATRLRDLRQFTLLREIGELNANNQAIAEQQRQVDANNRAIAEQQRANQEWWAGLSASEKREFEENLQKRLNETLSAPLTGKHDPPVAENGSRYGDISEQTGRPKTIHVNGYYRNDGTYVRGYYRSEPKQ